MSGMVYRLVLTVIGVSLFAVLDNASGRVIIASCICGASTFIVSEMASMNYDNNFLIYFISAILTCGMSEVGARIMRTPVTVILLPAIIPLVPGSLLYSAIKALLQGSETWYSEYGSEAVAAVSGIGVAIVAVSGVSRTLVGIKRKISGLILKE